MPIVLKNNASGFLSTPISASDPSIVLQVGEGAAFPSLASGEYFYATIQSLLSSDLEIVKATVRTGDVLTVVRAQEGTSALSFAAGSLVELRVTAQSVLDAINDSVTTAPATGIAFTPYGNIAATNVQAAIQEEVDDLAGAAGATAVGFTPYGNLVATNVQAAIQEEINDLAGAAGATAVGFTPYGSIAATNVQAAVQEVIDDAAGAAMLAVVAGTGDAIELTVTPAITAYANGQVFRFAATAVNTGPVTVKVSGLGAVSLFNRSGDSCVLGDIIVGDLLTIVFRATNFYMVSVRHHGGLEFKPVNGVGIVTSIPLDTIINHWGEVQAAGLTLTLPLADTYVSGTTISLMFQFAATIIVSGADTISWGSGIGTSMTFQAGETITFVNIRDSTTKEWFAIGTGFVRPADATQAEMEAGTESALRLMSPLRVAQAISVLSPTPLPVSPSARQTVLDGPVDSSGFAAFGGATGGTVVAAVGTITATAAFRTLDRIGSKSNPSWAGLIINGTMYLGVTVNTDGTLTEFATTLAPFYQFGGTYSANLGQRTYSIQEATMKVGDGTVANQAYDVFVGEVTVAGGVVTAIRWYAIQGRYDSGPIAFALGTTVDVSDLIGTQFKTVNFWLECAVPDLGFLVYQRVHPPINVTGNQHLTFGATNENSTKVVIGAGGIYMMNSSGTSQLATPASWRLRIVVKRDW